MFEISSSTANIIYAVSNAALAFGALCVLLGTLGVIWSGGVRERFSNERIAINESQTATANARAAEAELKSEQLRRELGPRHLQREIFLKEIAESPKARVEIMYLRDDPECFDLAQQVWRALEDASWDVIAPAPIPSNTIGAAASNPTAMAVDAQPAGVTVVVRGITQPEADAPQRAFLGQPWVRTPYTVLMHALGDSIGKVSGHAGGLNAPPDGTLRVVVAPR
jgi:hypothetical protein